MQEPADTELLRQYAEEDSEAAFAALVTRYIHLIYSAALRQTGNSHAAEEITQAVFIILARKARALRQETMLPGWLYQTARYTAANFLRREIRRARREQEAYMQSLSDETNHPPPDATEADIWLQIAPSLEDAMGRLSARERQAVVLRFFAGKSFQEVGKAFGGSENAAKKRVLRGLEKLRKFFARRSVSSTTAIIGGAISANSVQAAPAALAKSVTAVAVAGGTTASVSTLTLVKGVLKIMAWTKTKAAIAVGVGALLVTGTATVTVEKIAAYHLDESWRTLSIQPAQVDRLSPQVAILPTLFPPSGGSKLLRPGIGIDKFVGINVPIGAIASLAYRSDDPLGMPWPRERMIFTTPEPHQHYDFVATLSHGSQEALRQELKAKLGFVGNYETRDANTLVLRVKNSNAPRLTPASGDGYGNFNDTIENGQHHFKCDNQPLSIVAGNFERLLRMPIIDDTGLTQHFNIDLTWDDRGGQNALKQALLEQLGLELVPSKEPVEMLVIGKVK